MSRWVLAIAGHCLVTGSLAATEQARLETSCVERDPINSEVQLLQHQLELSAQNVSKQVRTTSQGATAELLAAEPLRWLHVPKCGTSFLNALIHLPGLCPDADRAYRVDTAVLGSSFELSFYGDCPQVCDTNLLQCLTASQRHAGIGSSYEDLKGHLVTMLRDPLQRSLSAFYDPKWPHGTTTDMSPATYAAEVQKGGMTCQIMRDGIMDPPGKECQELTEVDARLAAARLREGFAFVGITEEWDLSICLLHRVFGGQCLASDFEDTRPSVEGEHTGHDYNVSQLGGFEDPVDGTLYSEARQIFFEKLLEYNVTHESCRPCFEHAGRAARQYVVEAEIFKGASSRAPAGLVLMGAVGFLTFGI